MADDSEKVNERILREAQEVESDVRALYRLLRRPFDPDITHSGLTVPQINVLEELTREDGLSLKELSGRMALSHSTVSGIIDRLARRELLERKTDDKDRRYSRIFLAEEVREYVRAMSPSRRLGPISKALELASADQREQILRGIGTLRRLLETVVSGASEEQNTDATKAKRGTGGCL